MAKQQIIALSLLLVTMYGCRNRHGDNENKQDEFYNVTGGWDWIRVPLLKPYEAKKIDPEIETNGWGIKLSSSLYQVDKAKRIDVKDSIIYIQSGKVDRKEDFTAIGTRNVPTAWFVIDVRKKEERGFASESEFREYISKHNYSVPQWLDIDSLSEALGNGKKLPWQPE